MSDDQVPDEFPEFGKVLAGSTLSERSTETKSFQFRGKRYSFEIYSDGREDAELWSKLSTAIMHGYTLEGGARVTGQTFAGLTFNVPLGVSGGNGIKEIVVKDPAYIGAVKVLSLVLKRPAWSLDECFMMGSLLGQGFLDVCNWAASLNGVTEDMVRKMDQLEKNALNLSR